MAVQFQWFDSVEYEYLQLLNLVKELLLYLLRIFAEVLDVPFFISRSDHGKAVPLLEEAFNQVPDPVLLCYLLTEAFGFLETQL